MLQAKQQGLVPRCLAVITPGNPTGQVIEQDNQEELIIADEVYQVSCLGPGHISGSVVARSESPAGPAIMGCIIVPHFPAEGDMVPPRITQLLLCSAPS